MDEKLDKQICAQFPKLFRDRNKPMNQTAMCWGFSHGDGWYNIIYQLCSNMQHHIDHTREQRASALKYNRALKRAIAGDLTALTKHYTYDGVLSNWGIERLDADLKTPVFKTVYEVCPQVVVVQVKEKFGTLRFYYNGGDNEISGMVRMAESMSCVMCEECGAPGKTRGGGWVRTLCDKHAKKKK